MPDSILHFPQTALKACTGCRLEKPHSDFRVEKRTKIGLQSRCRGCEAIYASAPKFVERRRIYSENLRKTPERAAYMREYAKRPDQIKKNNTRTRAWQKENAERLKSNNDAWRAANTEKKRAINADWNARNKPAKAASLAKYRATKSKATPAWADLSAIKDIYIRAAACGMQVDHVIPLHGKNVCGLHVHNNLQILSKFENCSKGNRYIDA